MGSLQADRIWPSRIPDHLFPSQGRTACSPLEDAFNRWQDELLGTLYILLGSLREAQEAFEETFLYCWQRREQLFGLQDCKGWIFRAALETARQRRATAWRRRWRLWNLDSSQEQVSPPSGAMVPEENCSPQVAFWRRKLMELAPEEQEVFLLRQNAQLDYQQIADLLCTPLGVVKAQMRRALAKLRETAEHRTPQPLEEVSSHSSLSLVSGEAETLAEPVVQTSSDSPAQPQQEVNPQPLHILPIG